MKRIGLLSQILIAFVLAIIVGTIVGPKIAVVKPFGDLFLRMIKFIIVPLVLASLVVGVAGTGDIKKIGRMGGITLVYYLLTTAIAVTIGLILANIFSPGKGVNVSGAMDRLAHRVANLLVGNEEDLPTIEITLLGPTIEFKQDCLIAICGGDLSATINGKPIGLWRPILVKANSELKFGACKTGCRVYLAVAGGFTVPTVMNSKSTYLRAGIGGYEGRPLRTGDQLSVGKTGELSNRIMNQLSRFFTEDIVEEKWQVNPMRFFEMKRAQAIRVIKGRHFHLFSKESQDTFFQNDYTISNQSDRMGYRLKGKELILSEKEEMISEAVNFGTIQVPADGNPIILLADRQTTGGYPKIGQVASVDLSILAQAKPGDRIRFTEISFEKAQLLYLKRERKIHELKLGIYLKYS